MAEKILNTRIALKIDSLANWQSSPFNGDDSSKYLKKGEVAVVTIGTADPAKGEHPPVMFKVGDGISKFDSLGWASATAADVYGWAKQSENDFVNTFLTLKMSDGTTMQNKLDGVFATDAELQEAVEALQGAIDDVIAAAISIEDKEGNPVSVEHEEGSTVYTVSHNTIAAPTGTAGSGRTYLTGVSTDNYGHIVGFTTASEEDQDLSEYAKTADIVTNGEFEAFEEANTQAIAAAKQEAITEAGKLDATLKSELQKEIDDDISAYNTTAEGKFVDKTSYAADKEALEKSINDEIARAKEAEEANAASAKAANDKIDAFMSDEATVEGAIDTLIEINKYITEDTEAFTALSGKVTALEAKPGLDKVGTVTKVTAGDGLEGEITTEGTISLNAATKASLAKADTALQAADITGKADKVTGATNGNFAGLDANGNLTDSGKKAADFEVAGAAAAAQTAAEGKAQELVNALANGAVKANTEAIAALNITDGSVAKAEVAASVATDGVDTAAIINGAVTTDKLANDIQTSLNKANTAAQNIQINTGTDNGTIELVVDGDVTDNIQVKGLQSAAFTKASDYATAAQGALADSAVQPGDLAAIATTGNVNDLIQTSGDILVFNCGSASEVL